MGFFSTLESCGQRQLFLSGPCLDHWAQLFGLYILNFRHQTLPQKERICRALYGRIFFQDIDGKAKYTRIVGGLGWPGIKPGFAVVLGEDFDGDPSLKIRHVKVFAEIEEENIERLFQKCLEARDRYQVKDFFGNAESKGMMEFLYDFNRKLGEGVFPLRLVLAPFPEDLAYHAWVIRERITPGEKSLHLLENSSLKGFLLELGKEQVLKGNILDYPAVAALGYALSHIKSSPIVKVKPLRPDRVSSWKTV